MKNIQLAIVYDPGQGGPPLILQRVSSRSLLAEVIEEAISQLEQQRPAPDDPIAVLAREGQLRVLRDLREH